MENKILFDNNSDACGISIKCNDDGQLNFSIYDYDGWCYFEPNEKDIKQVEQMIEALSEWARIQRENL